jgi:hypothetical protein
MKPDPSFESLELSDLHTRRIFGFPRPVFVIVAGSIILTLLVGSLCIYNFVALPNGKRRLRRWRKPKSSFDDYEYAKFANRRLIEEYDDEDSEDELYNSSEFVDGKKTLIT